MSALHIVPRDGVCRGVVRGDELSNSLEGVSRVWIVLVVYWGQVKMMLFFVLVSWLKDF